VVGESRDATQIPKNRGRYVYAIRRVGFLLIIGGMIDTNTK
jgi:hypothetical protein